MTDAGQSEPDRAAGHHSGLSTQDSALRLSARAQAVLDLAHELARREPGIEPHSGHLLVALLRAGGGGVDDTFHNLGVDYEDVVAAVAAAPGAPDAKRELVDALAAAGRIARERGQVYIAAPSLLAALLDDPGSAAARALAGLGVEPDDLRRHLWAPRDMLVPLLALPDPAPAIARAARVGVRVRRARAWEGPALHSFITSQGFARTWAPESANAFARQPISVFLAERDGTIAGFAAYDCGLRGIFGPTGVAPAERASGVASALLLRTLADMRAAGYAYAIIGAVGPDEFYERACGAVLLPSAWPSYVESRE
jgi:N-acetylglutamate synthase-like GNAT family acetyltransferase